MTNNSKLETRNSKLLNQRGVALLLVLWIIILLASVAFQFSASVREDSMVTRRYAEESRGYYLAVAGFQDALHDLLNAVAPGARPPAGSTSPQSLDLVDGDWREKTLRRGLYRIRLTDESGKINLNKVDEATLRRIFNNLGMDPLQAGILTDSILDWRDEDDLHRTNGAENEYYLALSPSYTARNGPFDRVEDLLWVRGVTPEVFYGFEDNGIRRAGLRDIFTVDSPIDRVNLRTAPAEVIHAMTGLPLEKSRAFLEERKKLSETTIVDVLRLLGIAAGDAAVRQFVFTNPTVITIEVAGRDQETSSIERRVKGVVRVAQGGQGLQVARWIDRDFDVHNWLGAGQAN